MEIIVCDLDSTLADNGHRSHLAESKQWTLFHDICYEDTSFPWCVKLLEGMNTAFPELRFYFVTGRPERVREKTWFWLVKNLSGEVMKKAVLHMKPLGWNKGSAALKQKIYEDYIRPEHKVLFVLEDEHDVVGMWRAMGLVCLQPKDNHFESR